jgi:hypothetical protein
MSSASSRRAHREPQGDSSTVQVRESVYRSAKVLASLSDKSIAQIISDAAEPALAEQEREAITRRLQSANATA